MRGLAALEVDKFFANMFCQVNGEILYFWKKPKSNNLSISRTAERHSMLAVKKGQNCSWIETRLKITSLTAIKN